MIGGLLLLLVIVLLSWGIYRRSQMQKNIIDRLKKVEQQITQTDSKKQQDNIPNLFDSRTEQYILNISQGISQLKISLDLQK